MSFDLYEECILCPRHCKRNRNAGEKGYCGMTNELKIARAALHFWEEPCISGENGSGTVFFSGCSLRCVYCQNHSIACGDNGKIVDVNRLADIFLELEAKGANNINLVTATHYAPHIISALDIAKKQGLRINVVYNTGGYETVDNIKRLEGYIDVYLPDFKYASSECAVKYSSAADYPEVALAAIAEMVRQTGQCVFYENGIIKKGTIIRHLVLPGNIKNSKAAVKRIHDTFGDSVYISIMKQYTPMPHIMEYSDSYKELKRRLTNGEYKCVVDYAAQIGIINGFVQYGDNALESFVPQFDNYGV